MQLDFSRPGNATIESFNARRECLLQHYFSTLSEAQGVFRSSRADYNDHRTPQQLRRSNADRVSARSEDRRRRGEALELESRGGRARKVRLPY
ncbi:MAG: integrase core domain-containing protein [Candidatus Binatia bacterium]